jgi:hypothetical protein
MFFSLFNKNSGSIEKEMDDFIEKEEEKKENKLVKNLKYLKLFSIYTIC